MTIPDPPYPAPIAWSDILPGMRIRLTGTFTDGLSSVVGDGVVASIDASSITATSGLILPHDLGASVQFATETYELLDAFMGDVAEPTANSVVQAADGIVYQRAADPADPTNSVWYPVNSTTATDWTTITAAGTPTILLDGSTL